MFQGVNALQPGLTFGGFVSKLDPMGSTLLFSSVIGDSVNRNSSLSGVALDAPGNIYVGGQH